MKPNDKMHGFVVRRITPCPEQGGRVIELEHIRTGAPLYFVDREDTNMTFAISFRTVPTDDTGVFHILEHSVLCGSEKFPVKDPMTELFKGSISTYLNAFTYGEHTAYPVSSKNKKAFLDLINVYMDAVLHPLALTNKSIFLQEGHRLELDGEGNLSHNGVVYNEMRGVYASAEEYMGYLAGRLTYPRGCYGYDSGGNPDAVKTLTYENFIAAHKRYYHPSNSVLFLDGSVELDRVLSLLDSYLCEYDRKECFTDIPLGSEMITEPYIGEYPIAEGEDTRDKVRIQLVRRLCSHSEREKTLAASIAAEALADSNTAPLKKMILETGLCKNFSFHPNTGMKYSAFSVKFYDVKDGCEQELIAKFHAALDELLDKGISRDALEASLNSVEFVTREADYGQYPKGMVLMGSVIEDAICGDDPASGLGYDELFGNLRKKLDTPYYTDLLRELFRGNSEVTLILRPSTTLEAEREEAEQQELRDLAASMTEEQRAALARECEELSLWQSTPDSDEALASIPALTVSDLRDEIDIAPTEIYETAGVEVVSHPISTGGISYAELFFDVSDIDPDDIPAFSFMLSCLREFDTTEHTAIEMRELCKKNLGALGITLTPIKRDGEPRLYITVSVSCLADKKLEAVELVDEFLYKRRLTDPEVVALRLKQRAAAFDEILIDSALDFAIQRGAARYDRFEMLKEKKGGIELMKFIKRAAEDADAPARLLEKFSSLYEGYIVRERLTVGITEEDGAEFAGALIGVIKDGVSTAGECRVGTLPKINEGIAITSGVSYATLTSNMLIGGRYSFHGSLSTLQTVMNYEVLWNEIRVKGGAYGTGLIVRGNSGTLCAYSYRDPSPERSVSIFGEAVSMTRKILDTTPDLTKYIIGTVGPMDTVSTPRSAGSAATHYYLSGKSEEEVLRAVRESVMTTRDDLYSACDMLDRVLTSATVTVAGPKDRLAQMGLDEIIEL